MSCYLQSQCSDRGSVTERTQPVDEFVDLIPIKTIECYALCMPILMAFAAVGFPAVQASVTRAFAGINQADLQSETEEGESVISTVISDCFSTELDLLLALVTVGLVTGELLEDRGVFFRCRDPAIRGEGVRGIGVLLPPTVPPRLPLLELIAIITATRTRNKCTTSL